MKIIDHSVEFINGEKMKFNDRDTYCKNRTLFAVIPMTFGNIEHIRYISNNRHAKHWCTNDFCFLVTDGYWIRLHTSDFDEIRKYEKTWQEFRELSGKYPKYARYSFRITTQLKNLVEFGCKMKEIELIDNTIVKPYWLDDEVAEKYNCDKVNGFYEFETNMHEYIMSCENSFNTSQFLKQAGMNARDIVGVLPLDVAASTVITLFNYEWEDFLGEHHEYGEFSDRCEVCNLLTTRLLDNGMHFREMGVCL